MLVVDPGVRDRSSSFVDVARFGSLDTLGWACADDGPFECGDCAGHTDEYLACSVRVCDVS